MFRFKLMVLSILIFSFCSNKVDIINLQYRSWKVLESGLKDSNSEVRANACEAMGNTGLKEGVQYLLPLLEDKNANVRFLAAVSLAQLRDSTGMAILRKIINEGDSLSTIMALNGIIKFDKDYAINKLNNIFNGTQNRMIKTITSSILLENSVKKYSDFVMRSLDINNTLIKALCIESLTRAGIKIPEERVNEFENSDNPTVRIAALTYSGLNGNKKKLLELKKYLNHNNVNIRNYAAGNIIRVTLKYRRGIWED